ncbi:aminoacyl-tRNA hydrolase [Bordetella holmesii]|uniref:Peptidyl-tRNA hydrolase n=2 Tax=Bordetella holmesii TaxID=35814 RepID=A0A158M7E9_9BORD|nr:aminoacyl-tRNA hydrolase [Bordetella holmesii]AHV94361.1 peptidyl-tRNA hydrolase [Bordetella holmesii ATCC 51541]AIT25129.1 peptidyl-tRNA hydrolase [Bordetella holmesii 44057]EWM45693.1 peptidyl-tRNA hydrolase [Bordetella holmesii 70147]EWM48281.1 peptidyl-tRNA hydrolase [Bordetella holmesii 41130]EWM49816.1 peptidyl-tRNA hydrolase [Bordetella holmesii 35009]
MSEPIRLIVGLGNPGPDYETTRHNAGFWLADHLADDLRASFTLEKAFMGQVAKARFEGENVLLLKPITYMNRSGQAVGALARFYKLAPEQVLVLHDELDLLPGQVKMKQGGGHAGHNGLKDIQAALGTPNFWRLRIGIGHPRTLNLAQQVADFVLHPPRRDEQLDIEKVIDRCRAIVPVLLRGDFAQATRQLHTA